MSTSLLAALRNVEADRDAIAAERDTLRAERDAALREPVGDTDLAELVARTDFERNGKSHWGSIARARHIRRAQRILAVISPHIRAREQAAWRNGRDAAVRECDKEAQICAAEGNAPGASEAFVLSNLIRVLEPPA